MEMIYMYELEPAKQYWLDNNEKYSEWSFFSEHYQTIISHGLSTGISKYIYPILILQSSWQRLHVRYHIYIRH